MNKTLGICLVVTILGTVPCHAQGSKMPRPGYRGFELKQGFFHCKIPPWEIRRDKSEDRRQKVYGVFLIGPSAAMGPRPSLTIEYYAPGNTLFATAEQFLTRHQAPAPGRIWVSGKQAMRWVKTFSQSFPPNSLKASRVEMEEEYVLLDSGSGFHVLSFSAPKSSFRQERAAFKRVLETFQTFME